MPHRITSVYEVMKQTCPYMSYLLYLASQAVIGRKWDHKRSILDNTRNISTSISSNCQCQYSSRLQRMEWLQHLRVTTKFTVQYIGIDSLNLSNKKYIHTNISRNRKKLSCKILSNSMCQVKKKLHEIFIKPFGKTQSLSTQLDTKNVWNTS